MEALQVYTLTAYSRDIEVITVISIHMREPQVEEPDKLEENEEIDKKGVTTKIPSKLAETVYSEHIK